MQRPKIATLIPSILILVAIGYGLYWHPIVMTSITSFTTVVAALLFPFLISAYGRLQLGARQEASPLHHYFGQVIAFQFFIICLTLAVAYAMFSELHANQLIGADVKQVVNIVSEYTSNIWLLFPWSMIAMATLVQCMLVYVHDRGPYYYLMFSGYLSEKNGFALYYKESIEMILINNNLSVLALLVVGLIVLTATQFINILTLPALNNLPFIAVLVISLYMPIILLNRKRIRGLPKYGIDLFKFLLPQIVLLALFLTLASFLIQIILPKLPMVIDIATCNCTQLYQMAETPSRIAILYWGWFLLITPLCASWIAKRSKGRTVLEVTLANLFIPGTALIYSLLVGPINLGPLVRWISATDTILATMLSYTIILYTLYRLSRHQITSNFFFRGFMPAPEPYKAGKARFSQLPKLSGFWSISRWICTLLVGILIGMNVMGWQFFQLQLGIYGILIAYHFVFLSGIFVYQITQKYNKA